MIVCATAALFVAVWVAATILIDTLQRRRRRPDLTERLWPYRATTVADQADEWLSGRR